MCPVLPPVVLETDNRGKGRSRLVWSGSSRQEARFFWTDELKELGGLGGGFQGDSSAINLNIEPHPATHQLWHSKYTATDRDRWYIIAVYN